MTGEISLYTETLSKFGFGCPDIPAFSFPVGGLYLPSNIGPPTGKEKSGRQDCQIPNFESVSVYFHIPFCSKKCPYCHFFVLPNDEKLKTPFLTALLQEWALRRPQIEGKTIVSIYFGGGTPTKLPPAAYERLLATLRATAQIAPDCEITLEANPEDVTEPLMRAYAALGINRVSLGVQSLLDPELTHLGRTHNASASLQAVHDTHNAGIHNISIDLLFDLPHQTSASFERTLSCLPSLPITHLSLYNLTFEPHTPFFRRKAALTPTLPSPEESLSMLTSAVHALEKLNFHRYEISAFARSSYPSRHNSGYWTARPFLGLGPSACSYWAGARFSNTIRFPDYLTSLQEGRLPTTFHEQLPYPQNLQELLAIHLRLTSGVQLPTFTSLHGPLPAALCARLTQLKGEGLLESDGDTLRLTPRGQLFYDTVATALV